jgi:TolB-like protein
MGDGALVVFASAVDAVECATAMQRGITERNAAVPEDRQFALRIGINVGDVIIDGDDIHGDGVNIAARLEGICGPSEVFVSAAAYDQVVGKSDVVFDDMGKQQLKNIARSVQVYRVSPVDAPRPRTAVLQAPAELTLPDKPSIAVLPFDCYPVNAEQEAFANGMTEDLTTDLSKVGGLFVVARNSAQSIKEQASNLQEIAKALGVRYLLEGSVRKSGERVRINAQLIDALAGGHLWADRFDGTVHDVFELQDSVGAQIVKVLAVELSQSERKHLEKVHTDNLEAYELFVRAKATPYPPIPPRIEAAKEMFAAVVEMAPDYAGGYAGEAAMVAFGALFSPGDPSQAGARAVDIARHAIDLDEAFAWSYTALGMGLLLQRKYEEAVEAAGQTIALQPNDADGYAYLGLITGLSGDTSEGVRLLEEAIRLNPRFFAGPYWNILGMIHALAGNAGAALDALETNIRQRGPLAPPAYCSRAVAYAAMGKLEEAREVVEEMLSTFPDFRLSTWNLLRLFRNEEARRQYHAFADAAGVPD